MSSKDPNYVHPKVNCKQAITQYRNTLFSNRENRALLPWKSRAGAVYSYAPLQSPLLTSYFIVYACILYEMVVKNHNPSTQWALPRERVWLDGTLRILRNSVKKGELTWVHPSCFRRYKLLHGPTGLSQARVLVVTWPSLVRHALLCPRAFGGLTRGNWWPIRWPIC